MKYDWEKEVTAISDESVPLLVELVQRGAMSKTDALLQHFLEDVVRQYSGLSLIQQTQENTAVDTLLRWCNELQALRFRPNDSWGSKLLSSVSSADGIFLFNEDLRQEESMADLLEAFMSTHNTEEHALLSGRIISRLEHKYECWFEHTQGRPLTVSLLNKPDVSPHKDDFLDQQVEAVMRAALKAVKNGREPALEIVVANPGEGDTFRKLRDWMDSVAEQTLWAFFHSVPYRIGALMSVDRAALAAALELAYYTDLLFIDFRQTPPDHTAEYLLQLCDTITSLRTIRPGMEVWAILRHMEENAEAVFDAGVTGIVCHPSDIPIFKLRAAQWALQQNYNQGDWQPALYEGLGGL